MITLKSSHISIANELASRVFGEADYAYVAYVSRQHKLLIAPISSRWFAKIYEHPMRFLLKTKNMKGDKTLAVGEILIDNEVDVTDRTLAFKVVNKTNLIKIDL